MMDSNPLKTFLPTSFAVLVLLMVVTLPISAEEKQYGEPLQDGVTSVRIGELMAEPGSYVGKTIRVEGLVDDVCPMKGCWIKIFEEESKATIRFKVEDDLIVFPVEAKGQAVVAEGILRSKELDRDAAREWFKHLAEEKGESFDEASITGSMTIYEIEGLGARVGG